MDCNISQIAFETSFTILLTVERPTRKENAIVLKESPVAKYLKKNYLVIGDTTKAKWKNLKDGYTKYKKRINGTTGQSKQCISWVWGPYLQFLDSAIEPRPTTSNIRRNSEETQTPSRSFTSTQ